MNDNLVLTIGRENGSGGHHLGEMLAERLGIRYYDKELLTLSAKESGMCKELFESYDEKPNNSFLFSTVMDTYAIGNFGQPQLPINHKIFLAQFDTIKNLALRESCVIIGRCADYALADYPNHISIFITGDPEEKAKRISELRGITQEKAKDVMAKADKKRANYYNYFTSKKWGDAASYDLCINSSKVGFEGAIDLILEYIKLKERNQKA